MADIKYLLKFGKREHLESLVSGNIYCSNAITFWGIEDKLKIKGQGDILEAGTRMFAQKRLISNPLSQIVTSNPRSQPDTHFAVDIFPYKKTELFQKSGFKSKPPKKPGNTPLSGT